MEETAGEKKGSREKLKGKRFLELKYGGRNELGLSEWFVRLRTSRHRYQSHEIVRNDVDAPGHGKPCSIPSTP